MTVTEQLAQFAVSAPNAPEALEMMQLSLFDWAACGIAGRAETVAQISRDMVLAEGGVGQAALIGGGRAPARGAALVNGASSHALDYDDTHFAHIGHPSVAVIPAALAMAEHTGAEGEALLNACLAGAELSIRVGVWLGRSHYQTGFHQTGTAGAFGATAAAGRLLGLTSDQMAHALGLCATRAAGLKSQFGTMGKPYNAGIAAATGTEVAQLAAAGFVSNPEALEGAQGFGPTHAGEADITALDGLGEDWYFTTISHKFHACCHGLHASLEAIAELPGPVSVDEIRRIEITTHPRWLTVCNIPEPKTGLEAKFSYRLTAAMALSGIETGSMDSYADAICADPGITALRDKVVVKTDDAMPETATKVSVHGAETLSAEHDLNAPILLETRAQKLRAKVSVLLGDNKADRLWLASQGTPNIAALTELLQAQ